MRTPAPRTITIDRMSIRFDTYIWYILSVLEIAALAGRAKEMCAVVDSLAHSAAEPAPQAQLAMAWYRSAQVTATYGGSTEIFRDVVAHRVLGLSR